MKKILTHAEHKALNRHKYYVRYMREWCKRFKLPFIAAYKDPKHRAEIIGNVARLQSRLNAGLFPV